MRNRTPTRTANRRRSPAPMQESGSMDTALHELFLEQLADMHNAEQQLVKALPKMAKAAEHHELRDAFENHLHETENQISRLEEVAESLGESIKRKKCAGMEGLIEEGKEMMDELEDSAALDAGLIAAAQKVEHYEIATYGTLCAWAKRMGHQDALRLLKESLNEEEATDEKLTGIAENVANLEAQEH